MYSYVSEKDLAEFDGLNCYRCRDGHTYYTCEIESFENEYTLYALCLRLELLLQYRLLNE